MKIILYFIFGFDKNILKISKENVVTIISFSILYLFLLSLSVYAFYHAMFLVTGNEIVSIVIGLFFSFLFHNMYRLIIATSFMGHSLKSKRQTFTYISVKGFLIIILSIFVSKSICTDVFESDINQELDNYKKEIISNYKINIDKNYSIEIDDLLNSYNEELSFNLLMNYPLNPKDSLELYSNLQEIEQKKKSSIFAINKLVDRSNFFMKKIHIVSSEPKHWLFTLLSIIIFLLPMYIYNTSPYFLDYQLSILNNNKNLVLSNYNQFTTKYIELLSIHSGKEIVINERYENPPFNTVLKQRNIKTLKKGSLFEWVKKYNG
tara:strand:- start:98 stop:1057 length:960 start_codon:yes stop_codon:yes gene_type:complete